MAVKKLNMNEGVRTNNLSNMDKAKSLYDKTQELIDELRAFYMDVEDKGDSVEDIASTLATISDVSKNIKYWSNKILKLGYYQDGTKR